jgi:hypothetical protein
VTNTDAVDTVVCAPDGGWKYHPKHVEQFSDINKLRNFALCWLYLYIGILLVAHPILHISRIRVNILYTFVRNVEEDTIDLNVKINLYYLISPTNTD